MTIQSRPGIRRIHWGLRIAVAALAAAVVSLGTASANSVSTDGQIQGCANMSTGALRIVAVGATCSSATETPRSWNQQALVWKGGWNGSASYGPNDGVSYGGAAWVATEANGGVPPATNSPDWTLLAMGGSAGVPGQKGPPGVQGPPGTPGNIIAQSVWYDFPQKEIPNTNNTQWTRVLTLRVKYAGAYTVFSKLDFGNDSSDNAASGGCELVAGSDVDYTNISLDNYDSATLQLNVSHDFEGKDNTAYVACQSSASGATVYHIKITAIDTGWPYYAWK